MAQFKKDASENSLKKKENELRWLQVVVEVFFKAFLPCNEINDRIKEISERLLSCAPNHIVEKKKSGGKEIHDFLTHIVNGNCDWNKFIVHISQTVIDINNKRSARFKNAKQELVDSLSSQSCHQLMSEADDSRNGQDNLTVHMQNRSVYELICATMEKFRSGELNEQELVNKLSTVHGKIKGDAELRRSPWTIIGDKRSQKEVDSVVHHVLTGDVIDTVSTVVVRESTEHLLMKEMKNGDAKAIALANRVINHQIDDIVKQFDYSIMMFDVMEKLTSKSFTEIVEVLLLNWKDTNRADQAAMELF